MNRFYFGYAVLLDSEVEQLTVGDVSGWPGIVRSLAREVQAHRAGERETLRNFRAETIAKHNRIIELEEELRHRPTEVRVSGFTLAQVQRLIDLAVERAGARARKDYERADAIRSELLAAGLAARDARPLGLAAAAAEEL